MTNPWDAPMNKLSEQIKELQHGLEANQEVEKDQLQELEMARQRLQSLMHMPSTGDLSELPRLLQSVLTQQAIGVIILGEDGKVLLFNAFADRVFGLSNSDLSSSGVQTGSQLFLEDGVTLYDSGHMPWDRALHGENVPQMQLFLKRPDLPQGMWISITCTALTASSGLVSGAVALVLDVTEYVKIGEQIKHLCNQLENQLQNMEMAREELQVLTTKLASKGANQPPPVLSPMVRPPVPEAAKETMDSSGKTVLVVDDIPVNQKLLIMHLKKMGFQVDSAFNGKLAVESVAKKEYAMVFMDCDMPVMNGYEATQAIRAAELSTGRHTPIVAMTSYDRVGDRERCLSVGMDEYLTKGVTQKRLQEVVQWCLSRNQAAVAEPVTSSEEEKDERLDIDSLIKTFGDFELEEILRLFLMSSTTLTSCLQFAIEDHDAESVSHFAYSMKGPCSSIGLKQLAKLAADITTNAENGNWDVCTTQYKRFRTLYFQVKDQIDKASEEFKWVLT